MFDEQKLKEFIVAAVFSAFQEYQPANIVQAEPATEKKYIYSIRDLAKFLNCSVVTAQHLKNKGLVPCKQLGRKLIFDADEVLAAMHTNKPLKGRRA